MKSLVLLGDSHLASLNKVVNRVNVIKTMFPKTMIVDLSQGGANSENGLLSLKETQIKSNSTVIIMFGTNDAASWKEIPIEKYDANLKEIAELLKEKGCSLVFVTPPPVNINKQIPPGRSNASLANYANVVIKVAREFNSDYIDLFNLIEKVANYTDIHESDGVHLNELGYSIFKKQLTDHLIQS